jgi:cellulose synthase (UDP-forming)
MRSRWILLGLIVIVTAVNLGIGIVFDNPTWMLSTPLLPLFPLVIVLILLLLYRFRLWRVLSIYKLLGLLMIFSGQQYVIHSLQVALNHPTLLGWVHFVALSGAFCSLILHFFNQANPRYQTEHMDLPRDLPHVVAIIPTYNEAVEILERTLRTLLHLDYPREKFSIVFSDDGHRDEVRQLAERYGVHYNLGAQRDAKAGNLNSALHYIDVHIPDAQLVLTQDADELIKPEFLRVMIPYFTDPRIGFVQTPKESIVPLGDPFGSRDRVFYDRIQVGRNGDNAAFSCGSGVVWRLEAIHSIGGFSTWNIVEDLTTSYNLHAAGWHSAYHNEIMTVGLSPEDIPTLIKQRGTWATDSWRLFLFDNPFFKPGLSVGQRLHYAETGISYLTNATFSLLMMYLPLISTAFNDFLPINSIIVLSWMLVHSCMFLMAAQGNFNYFYRMRQFWDGMAVLSLKAFWIAVRSRHKKPSYVVTRKTRLDGFHGGLILPQILYTVAACICIVVNGVDLYLDNGYTGARISNAIILLYFVIMHLGIISAAFYGVTMPRRLANFTRSFRSAAAEKLNEYLVEVPAVVRPMSKLLHESVASIKPMLKPYFSTQSAQRFTYHLRPVPSVFDPFSETLASNDMAPSRPTTNGSAGWQIQSEPASDSVGVTH